MKILDEYPLCFGYFEFCQPEKSEKCVHSEECKKPFTCEPGMAIIITHVNTEPAPEMPDMKRVLVDELFTNLPKLKEISNRLTNSFTQEDTLIAMQESLKQPNCFGSWLCMTNVEMNCNLKEVCKEKYMKGVAIHG